MKKALFLGLVALGGCGERTTDGPSLVVQRFMQRCEVPQSAWEFRPPQTVVLKPAGGDINESCVRTAAEGAGTPLTIMISNESAR